jgi:hypothetical protein
MASSISASIASSDSLSNSTALRVSANRGRHARNGPGGWPDAIDTMRETARA